MLIFIKGQKCRQIPIQKFSNNKSHVAQMKMLVSKRVKRFIGTGENANYKQFFLFPQCFPKSYPEELSRSFGKGLIEKK